MIKSESKDRAQNIYISNKCCSFELSILKESWKNAAQKFLTLIIIRNVSWAAIQH